MFRNKNILTLLALLVFTAMTFNDMHFMFIEKEELIEGREIDDVKEEEESNKSVYKFHSIGGGGILHSTIFFNFSNLCFNIHSHPKYAKRNRYELSIPLFIMYCTLRLHLI